MNKRTTSQTHHERGAALVEAAFVIPFFALILSAVFELGRLLYFFQILTAAAYEGARFASQLPQMAISCFDKDHTDLDKGNSIPSGLAQHYYTQELVRRVLNTIAHNAQTIAADYEPPSDKINPYIDANGATISTRFIANNDDSAKSNYACQTVADEAYTVGVRIEKAYTGLIFPLKVPVRTTVHLPYLSTSDFVRLKNTDAAQQSDLKAACSKMVASPMSNWNGDLAAKCCTGHALFCGLSDSNPKDPLATTASNGSKGLEEAGPPQKKG